MSGSPIKSMRGLASCSTWQLEMCIAPWSMVGTGPTSGKAAFGRLVDDMMDQEVYRSARRVFWNVDELPLRAKAGLDNELLQLAECCPTTDRRNSQA